MGSLAKKSQVELKRELKENKEEWERQGSLDIGLPPIFSIEIYFNISKRRVILKQNKGGFDGKMIECSFPQLPTTTEALGEVIEHARLRVGIM